MAWIFFLIPTLVGLIIGVTKRNTFLIFLGAACGMFLGFLTFCSVSAIDSFKAREAVQQAQRAQRVQQAFAEQVANQEIYNTMPEDWKDLHRFLKRITTVPLRQAYVKDFLRDKTEPELSADAYEVFYSTCSIDISIRDYQRWERWLAEALMPFAVVNTKAAINAAKQDVVVRWDLAYFIWEK